MGKVGGTIPTISSRIRTDFQTDFQINGDNYDNNQTTISFNNRNHQVF